jgi:hypothetical protein
VAVVPRLDDVRVEAEAVALGRRVQLDLLDVDAECVQPLEALVVQLESLVRAEHLKGSEILIWVRWDGRARRPVPSVGVGARVGGVGECGCEEAVRPVFGVAAGVGVDELNVGVADVEACELVCEPGAVDMLEFEQSRIPRLDHDRGERQFGEALHLERECSVGECAGEVLEGLPFDSRDDRSVRAVDRVVASEDSRADSGGSFVGELPALTPSSTSGRRTQLRSVSGVGPNFAAIETIAAHCDAYSC